MALDVYVGSLTRYYAGEWKNVPPEAPRALGRPPQPSRRSVGGGVPTQAELRPTILAWRAGLARSLGNRIETPLDWDEGEQTPYFSGRPGWDGFGSLVLWAAYAEHPAVRLPASLPEEWDHDPVLMRSTATAFRSRYSHLVRNVELWLPGSLEFTFEGEDVDGRRAVMGSAESLHRQLEELNAATWKAGAGTVVGWGGEPPLKDAPLEQNARYGFAVMFDLARRAITHRLPMKLDY